MGCNTNADLRNVPVRNGDGRPRPFLTGGLQGRPFPAEDRRLHVAKLIVMRVYETAPSRTYYPERGHPESTRQGNGLLLLRAPYLGKIVLFESFQYLGGVWLLPLLRLGKDQLPVDCQSDVALLDQRHLGFHACGFLDPCSQTGRSGWIASALAVF